MKANQHNQIEAYLSGEMNPEQLAKFESELQVNPELQQELSFQTEVIQGIGEYRKAELVARMEAINVSPVWWSFVEQFSALQYIGGAVVATIIGGAAWFAFQDTEELTVEPTDIKTIVIDTPSSNHYVWDLPIDEIESKTELITEEGREVEVLEEEKGNADNFSPVVAVPLVNDVEVEKEFVPEEAGEPEEISTKSTSKATPIDVEILESKGTKIKYRYYAGKLYLYGEFQSQPYEIIEINSASGRRIYLFHMNEYYGITPSDKPVSLEPISDSKLIQELSILREAK
jgi:hypothetical protein